MAYSIRNCGVRHRGVWQMFNWFRVAGVSACGSMPLLARQAIVQHRALPGE
jgi:hypothetical protein